MTCFAYYCRYSEYIEGINDIDVFKHPFLLNKDYSWKKSRKTNEEPFHVFEALKKFFL